LQKSNRSRKIITFQGPPFTPFPPPPFSWIKDKLRWPGHVYAVVGILCYFEKKREEREFMLAFAKGRMKGWGGGATPNDSKRA
jgi:hypothetical protein